MNSLEYEMAIRKLRQSNQAKEFLPFYRNVLQPILEQSVIDILSSESKLDSEQLIEIRAFSKTVKDMETILNRLIVQGQHTSRLLDKVRKERGEEA